MKDCGSTGPFDEEHSTPFKWTGALPDQLMCRACHKKKTKADKVKIAKVNRLLGITGKLKRKALGKQKKITSPGFDKTKTRDFNGKVKPRARKRPDHE